MQLSIMLSRTIIGQAERERLRMANDSGDLAIPQYPLASLLKGPLAGKLANPSAKFGMDRRAPFIDFDLF